MTILPTKRTTSSAEDNNDNSGQGGNSERTGRRRDEHSANHIDSNKSSNRRTFRRSATPESNEHSLRKRFKESTKSGTSSSSGNSNQSAQMGTRRHNRDNQNSSSTSRGDNTTTNNNNSSSTTSTSSTSKSLASKRSIQPNPQPSASEQQESDAVVAAAAAATAASVAASSIEYSKADVPLASAAADTTAVADCVVDRPNNAVELATAAQQQQQEPLIAQDDQQQLSAQVQDGLEAQQSAQQLLNLDEAGNCLLLNQHQSASPRPSDDDATGFNSEDEYSPSALNSRASIQATTRGAGKSAVQTHQQLQQQQQQQTQQHCNPKDGTASISEEEWNARDATFARCLTNLGYEVKPMHEDGACLFRAIADQVYGDQEMHYVVRSHCMDYIVQNKDFFAPYVTEDFDKYVARKRQWHVHGNHLEIQAMSEMYNRRIEVYCYRIEPINIFSGLTGRGAHGRTYEPIRLSYHRMCHYNSISNPDAPSVGVGLGLPAYHPIDLNRRRLGDAVRASEQLLIEQTMLEDKLQATDWEATSEAIEEAVARESYIQYYRDAERRVRPPAAPTATVTTATHNTSNTSAASTSTTTTTTTSTTAGSAVTYDHQHDVATAAAKNAADDQVTKCGGLIGAMETLACAALPEQADTGQQSPQASSSRTNTNTNTGEQSPNAGELSEDEWNDGILAQILAESRKTYFDELKRNSKKGGSPGPSTSR